MSHFTHNPTSLCAFCCPVSALIAFINQFAVQNELAKGGEIKHETKPINKRGKSTNEQTSRSFIGQKGLSMDGWPDEVVEGSPVPAAPAPAKKPGVGASQAQEQQPSLGSACSKLPPLISTQLAWSSICCLEWHANTLTTH